MRCQFTYCARKFEIRSGFDAFDRRLPFADAKASVEWVKASSGNKDEWCCALQACAPFELRALLAEDDLVDGQVWRANDANLLERIKGQLLQGQLTLYIAQLKSKRMVLSPAQSVDAQRAGPVTPSSLRSGPAPAVEEIFVGDDGAPAPDWNNLEQAAVLLEAARLGAAFCEECHGRFVRSPS